MEKVAAFSRLECLAVRAQVEHAYQTASGIKHDSQKSVFESDLALRRAPHHRGPERSRQIARAIRLNYSVIARRSLRETGRAVYAATLRALFPITP